MSRTEKLVLLAAYADTYFLASLLRIVRRSDLLRMRDFIQHGDTTCLLHTIAVAYYSDRIARRLRMFRFNKKELIRGALLHDYFLYDWHEDTGGLHGFRHPAIALRNALRHFLLTRREQDIIKKHMFPLTLRPPRYRESVIVTLVDKACSLYETFKRRNAYRKSRARLFYHYLLQAQAPEAAIKFS